MRIAVLYAEVRPWTLRPAVERPRAVSLPPPRPSATRDITAAPLRPQFPHAVN